jgi:hypothetical protein
MKKIVLLSMVFSLAVVAQESPRGRTLTVMQVALASADASKTCQNLSNGGHERFMPTQSCAGVTGFIAGGVVLNVVARYWLLRHGHPELSTALGVIGSAESATAVIYSSTH